MKLMVLMIFFFALFQVKCVLNTILTLARVSQTYVVLNNERALKNACSFSKKFRCI